MAAGSVIRLALAEYLVEMHGGRIEAQCDGIGKGNELSVRLPLATVPPRTPIETVVDHYRLAKF
jgi:signal transduction histidine kinase